VVTTVKASLEDAVSGSRKKTSAFNVLDRKLTDALKLAKCGAKCG